MIEGLRYAELRTLSVRQPGELGACFREASEVRWCGGWEGRDVASPPRSLVSGPGSAGRSRRRRSATPRSDLSLSLSLSLPVVLSLDLLSVSLLHSLRQGKVGASGEGMGGGAGREEEQTDCCQLCPYALWLVLLSVYQTPQETVDPTELIGKAAKEAEESQGSGLETENRQRMPSAFLLHMIACLLYCVCVVFNEQPGIFACAASYVGCP